MKKLDEGQKIIARIVLGMGIVIVATQIALYFANRQKTQQSSAPAMPAPAPSAPAGIPGQV